MPQLDDLRAVTIFSGLNDETLARIAELVTSVDVAADHLLMDRGQAGSGLFLIEEGGVVVEREGRRLELGPGSFVGELALLTDRGRTARVRTTVPSKLLAISRADFRHLLRSEPDIALALLGALAERLADG
jgi:CRP-like cAMP-binding protein